MNLIHTFRCIQPTQKAQLFWIEDKKCNLSQTLRHLMSRFTSLHIQISPSVQASHSENTFYINIMLSKKSFKTLNKPHCAVLENVQGTPSPGRKLDGGSLRAKFLKESIKLIWNFCRGGMGFQQENLQGVMEIFWNSTLMFPVTKYQIR